MCWGVVAAPISNDLSSGSYNFRNLLRNLILVFPDCFRWLMYRGIPKIDTNMDIFISFLIIFMLSKLI
jgi:hypothetical protein